MKQYESEHYIFNYHSGSKAEEDLLEIVELQEACFKHICNVLKVELDFKIQYFFCTSPEEAGQIYGDNEPCNGFVDYPDIIYAVYNNDIKCVGFHEDAHLISYKINRPDCPAIREGLAMYFDRYWWGINNLDWTVFFIKNNRYVSLVELLDKEKFFFLDCTITYPIMGAFTDWLINSYGIERYLSFYKKTDSISAIEEVYGMTIEEIDEAFKDYLSLFKINKNIRKEMLNLLSKNGFDC
ncbi:MAG: hypothetical protein ACOX1L_04320 [Erysipelotrichaceae bacterium]|jgi:hypothetical protein